MMRIIIIKILLILIIKYRTIAEIRRDNQIPIPVNKDSLYKPITRVRREFSKIVIPKKLQEVFIYLLLCLFIRYIYFCIY